MAGIIAQVRRGHKSHISVALQIPFSRAESWLFQVLKSNPQWSLALINQAQSYGLLEPISGTSIPIQDKEYLSFGDIQKKYKGFFWKERGCI